MTPIVNPILRGFHPDPSWMWHDGRAWLVTSSFGLVPGLPIHTSTDLAHWQREGAAIDEEMAKKLFLAYIDSDDHGVFAPSIRMIGDAMVIVSTVVRVNEQRALENGADPAQIEAMHNANGNFALVSHDHGHSWEGPHWINGARGNDPDVFIDTDGTSWWVCSHQSDNPQWRFQSDIVIRRLNLDTWSLEGPEHVLWHGALEGATWAESPHILRHDGQYYLLAAEAGTERHHAQTVARSRELIAMYEGNPRNPILTHRHLGERFPVQNVGHCDLLQDNDGRWWGVCLGSRIVDGYSFMGREPMVFPVTWEHDWPVFAPGSGLVPHVVNTDDGGYSPVSTGTSETTVTDTPTESWHTTTVSDDNIIQLPWQHGWQWAKVDTVDFSVILNPVAANEARIQQDRNRYAALVADCERGIIQAIIHDAKNADELIYEGTLDANTDYVIRLNGTTIEFRKESHNSAYKQASATDMPNTTMADLPAALTIRRGSQQSFNITAGGWPVLHANSKAPTGSELFATHDATFLSTESAGGYVGCLAGIR
ncbi:glycoside hydrolase family 43 protein [Bifidobacterium goeldii]|nr:glycoside hydrolase family 43 protein [Bifidobacterium goeldii]